MRPGWLADNRNLLLTVLEAASPRPRCQHGQVLLRSLFWAVDCWLLVVSSHSGKKEWPELSGFLVRILIPFMRAPPSGPKFLPKTPPPTSHWGLDFSLWNLGAPDSMDQGLSEGALFSLIHSADIYWTVTMCHALETQPGADRLVPAFMGLMVQCERSLKKKKSK